MLEVENIAADNVATTTTTNTVKLLLNAKHVKMSLQQQPTEYGMAGVFIAVLNVVGSRKVLWFQVEIIIIGRA